MYKKKGNNMTIKLYKQIQFSDGYVFYEQKNGRYTDTKKEEDCDLSFDSWKDIQDALDNDDLEISICKLYKK
jgi:hypothetical protein|tara:strand:- start:128 stop:343 length:216 start_codon:yes stop_codon:yes gene_type:complete